MAILSATTIPVASDGGGDKLIRNYLLVTTNDALGTQQQVYAQAVVPLDASGNPFDDTEYQSKVLEKLDRIVELLESMAE